MMVVMVVIVGVIVVVGVGVGVIVIVIVGVEACLQLWFAFCNFPFDDILVVSQRVFIVQIYLKHTLVRFSLKI